MSHPPPNNYDDHGEADAQLRYEAGMYQSLYEVAKVRIGELEAALRKIAKDPPANLDEPDLDWEVIAKMRAIARAVLGLARNSQHSDGEAGR